MRKFIVAAIIIGLCTTDAFAWGRRCNRGHGGCSSCAPQSNNYNTQPPQGNCGCFQGGSCVCQSGCNCGPQANPVYNSVPQFYPVGNMSFPSFNGASFSGGGCANGRCGR